MTVIDTSTASTATAYSNQRKVDRCQNGVLWAFAVVGGSSSLIAKGYYSTDDGATWTASSDVVSFGPTTNSAERNISLFIDLDDFAHVVFKDNGNGRVYYRRGTPNAARTAWTWSAATLIWDNTSGNYPDLAVHREGTGWKVHIMMSTTGGLAYYWRLGIASDGTVSRDSGDVANPGATLGSSSGVSIQTWPSIDFNHTGDGKTVAGGTPHLYVAWSSGKTGAGFGIRFKKAIYSAGAWNWDPEREIDSTRYVSSSARWLNCLFDGTRVVLSGFVVDASPADDLVIYERDAADTTTTTRVLLDNPSTALSMYYGSSSYDDSGNVYLFGRNTDEAAGSYDLVYRKWERSSGTLEAEVIIDSDVGDPFVSSKRGHSNTLIDFVYTDGSTSPYDVTYGSVSLNVPPNAPTGLSPDGNTVNKDVTQRFSWSFSDDDAGDTQSAYDLRYREQGTTTWTTVSGGVTQYHDFVAGTFTAGDWEWQVRTYDSASEVGPWSALATFTAGTAPAAPTISAPTNGQIISTEDFTVEWTPSSDAYEVRRVADDGAGNPDTATVYFTTGTQESTGTSHTVQFPTNNRDEHVQVRRRLDGLWSSWASALVTVSYTEPATPSLTTLADTPIHGAVRVTPSHPTPAAGEPTVESVDLFRREALKGGNGERIRASLPPSADIDIYTSRSGVEYEFQVKAYGDNGATSLSAWTA